MPIQKNKDLIAKQQTNLADVDYLNLNSIAKVLKDFESTNENQQFNINFSLSRAKDYGEELVKFL